jgi:CRISPR-associated protein Csx10
VKQIQLIITAKSPLAIGYKKPGSVSEAADFISGSVIRGAIAAYLLRSSPNQEQPEPGDDFSLLFVDENAAIFQNAYPTNNNAEVKVLPSTVVSAKAKPGFKPKGYGVFDTLIDRLCAEKLGYLYDPNCPTALEKGDDGRVEPFSGFYIQSGKSYKTQSVSKRLLTRVGINRRRATSEEQILYSLEVLNESKKTDDRLEPVTYRSAILLDDEGLANHLTQFINTRGDRIHLGGSTSRGLGRVEMTAKCGNYQSKLKERIDNFNKLLHQRWGIWSNLYRESSNDIKNLTFFTIDLQSDAILSDRWKRTTVISPQMLKEFAGIDDPTLELEAAYSSYDTNSGWNSAWRLMKDIELTTTRGTVYLFSSKEIERWYEPLKKLECSGIGDRTLEGFGQVEICNEFHTIFREKVV